MKTHITLAASLLILAACGGGGEQAETPAPSETATPEATPTPAETAKPEATPTETNTEADPEETPEPQATEAPSPEPQSTPTEAAFDMSLLPAPYNEADLVKGRRLYRQCATCHLVNEGGRHRVGPNLYGIIDAAAGEKEGFSFSKAMKESGIVWTPENISAYIENPRAFMPGNRMSFAGLRRPQDRVDVIAYLMIESGYTGE